MCEKELIEFVNRSSYRKKVMEAVENKPLFPIQISKKSGIKVNHISKVLAELKTEGLIECINEEAKKGRLYRQTDKGKDIFKKLKI